MDIGPLPVSYQPNHLQTSLKVPPIIVSVLWGEHPPGHTRKSINSCKQRVTRSKSFWACSYAAGKLSKSMGIGPLPISYQLNHLQTSLKVPPVIVSVLWGEHPPGHTRKSINSCKQRVARSKSFWACSYAAGKLSKSMGIGPLPVSYQPNHLQTSLKVPPVGTCQTTCPSYSTDS